jgi:26S proteasome regulatory subunit N10
MDGMDEDAELQRALEMSMNDNNGEADQEMMSAVLGSLPGVDANDARIQKALDDMKDKNKKKDGEDK